MFELWTRPPLGLFAPHIGYALATLVRTLEFDQNTWNQYLANWKQIFGCVPSGITRNFPDNFPPPYTVAYHANCTVIAFAGCQNASQALRLAANCHLAASYGGGQALGLAHQVAAQIREAIFGWIDQAPNKDNIIVCGHSLGGAVAALMARYIMARYGNDKVAYGMWFGSPRAGDSDFVAGLERKFFDVHIAGDPVPNFPRYTSRFSPGFNLPTGYGFCHNAGIPIHIGDFGIYGHGRVTTNHGSGTILLDEILPGDTTLQQYHALDVYVDYLKKISDISHKGQLIGDLRHLNAAMTGGFTPQDVNVPTPPRVTTPIPEPAAPSVAQVQRVNTAPDPTPAPTPPVYNSNFVGQGNQAIVRARVSRSLNAKTKFRFLDEDYRKLRNAKVALQALVDRESSLSSQFRGNRPPKHSAFINWDDPEEVAAVWKVLAHLYSLLELTDAR